MLLFQMHTTRFICKNLCRFFSHILFSVTMLQPNIYHSSSLSLWLNMKMTIKLCSVSMCVWRWQIFFANNELTVELSSLDQLLEAAYFQVVMEIPTPFYSFLPLSPSRSFSLLLYLLNSSLKWSTYANNTFCMQRTIPFLKFNLNFHLVSFLKKKRKTLATVVYSTRSKFHIIFVRARTHTHIHTNQSGKTKWTE